jgi:hypothetical protein
MFFPPIVFKFDYYTAIVAAHPSFAILNSKPSVSAKAIALAVPESAQSFQGEAAKQLNRCNLFVRDYRMEGILVVDCSADIKNWLNFC